MIQNENYELINIHNNAQANTRKANLQITTFTM
jgi:hypothetical protein